MDVGEGLAGAEVAALGGGEPLSSMVADWRGLLALSVEEAMLATFRRHERTGRPLGDAAFLARPLRPRKAGRPRKKEKK